MQASVMVLGGYGNFGKRIVQALVKDRISVIIAGRSLAKAESFAQSLPRDRIRIAAFDVSHDLESQIKALNPKVVINTCGPFQDSDYRCAQCCIRQGIHYIDLADGRDFVTGISKLNKQATQASVNVISGASTVPGLSSAVIEHFIHEFSDLQSVRFGISPGQRAERGLATTKGILTYVGRPLRPFVGSESTRYGWQDIHRQDYPEIGKRWMANCDIPDLDLLPQRYGIKSIQFSAGLELCVLHLGLWAASWLVRLGVPLNLPYFANAFLKASDAFNGLGTSIGGMHMILSGLGQDGQSFRREWYIIARDAHGPHIPTIPAIILAKKIITTNDLAYGASPCVGLVSLNEYLQELRDLNVRTYIR